MGTKMKNGFYVYSAFKSATLDDYHQGEIGETQTFDLTESSRGFYKSIEELSAHTGLTPDLGAWFGREGEIICNRGERESGSEASPYDYVKFRTGEIKVYNCVYAFLIKIVEGVYIPSAKEVGKKFNIETL